MNERAYRTDDAGIVGAYRDTVSEAQAQGKKIREALAALGVGDQIYVRSSGFSGDSARITDLVPVGDHIPDGWRLMKRTGRLEPRRGKPGESARQWLLEHQPIDIRTVMEKHGLPRAAWVPGEGFGWRVIQPSFFEHDGALWACYAAEPGTSDSGFDTQKCTWQPCNLSEFHAAREAHEFEKEGS